MKHLDAFLKRNRELAEAATPGPWTIGEDGSGTRAIFWESPWHGKEDFAKFFWPGHPAEATKQVEDWWEGSEKFIAASRTSLPLALEMLSMTVEWITARRDAAFANMEGTDGTEFQQWSELWGISENILAALEEKAGRG